MSSSQCSTSLTTQLEGYSLMSWQELNNSMQHDCVRASLVQPSTGQSRSNLLEAAWHLQESQQLVIVPQPHEVQLPQKQQNH